eukprot:TRINITY_DN21638_c0_g1_i2.p1 TRINITY_DN21638_c0_g1~~TRINITY_DN21638_c0_g1_i2.p1  ORF type:complete len:220 (-),score=36.34 TRINITY_DN21638_c0_g1_i2:111-770(-)
MLRPIALLLLQVLVVTPCVGSSGKRKAPTLSPGDGRKRNWTAIQDFIELEWVNQVEECVRSNQDGDTISFNHKGFIKELPPGKTTDGKGNPVSVGQQIDANYDPESKSLKPLEFVLGTPRLIVGMEAALRLMCVGEVVRATIPGGLAYNGRLGFLPYGTTVMYEMEVLSFTKGPGYAPEEKTTRLLWVISAAQCEFFGAPPGARRWSVLRPVGERHESG